MSQDVARVPTTTMNQIRQILEDHYADLNSTHKVLFPEDAGCSVYEATSPDSADLIDKLDQITSVLASIDWIMADFDSASH